MKVTPKTTTEERVNYMRSRIIGAVDMKAAEKAIANANATLDIYCNGARVRLADGRKFTRVGDNAVAKALEAAGIVLPTAGKEATG